MYSELTSVEVPLVKTLEKLGWKYIPPSQIEELRNSFDNPFITSHLQDAIQRLNGHKGITDIYAHQIIQRLKKIDDNEEFYNWLKGECSFQPNSQMKHITIDLIDTENINNNQFVVTNQCIFDITKPEDNQRHIRPDLVLYVNGIPLTIIECKFLGTEGSTYQEGIKQLERYQRVAPQVFIPNVFNITTDLHILKYGATGSTERYFLEWKYDCSTPPDIEKTSEFKKYAKENNKEYNPYIDMQVFSLLNRANFIDLITNFVVYETRENITIKKIGRYQQFRAVNKIVDRVKNGKMKTGLVWHTQGSGKSLTMLFTAWKLRKQTCLNNPTIFIVVDRVDLDNQISGTFEAVKMPNTTRADSINDLRSKLKQDRREVIITTVFKFQDMQDILIDRENVILLIDEAHRTQEGVNSAEMRRSLPNAYFFGFTGTPIDRADKNTHINFGKRLDGKIERYLDLYNIKQSIDDGFTVPVHYQLRNREWQIDTDDIDEYIDIAFPDLTEEEMDNLKGKASSYKTFMLTPERLETVSRDIAEHFKAHVEPNGFKAQVVCFTREACVIIKEHLDKLLGSDYSEIVYSSGQNDKPALVKYHKSKDDVKTVIETFIKKESHLKILIVQSMLLTGFDAPVEQVMYLDRPLKDHNLLQAIARTNRPYPNKKCGLIVDYCGILRNLNKALNFDESDIQDCLIDFDKLKKQLPQYINDFKKLFKGANINNLSQCLKHIEDNELDTKVKEIYNAMQITYETICPDPFILDYTKDYIWATKLVIARKQQLQQEKPDISEYLAYTKKVIQEHIHLSEINEKVPVFVVDDNYLKKLDGTNLTNEEKELTLEHRLRSILRIKVNTLPVYKTLQERLENIIKQKEAEGKDLMDLLEELMGDFNNAEKEEKELGLTKGQLSIYQSFGGIIKSKNLSLKITSILNEIIISHTKDFKNWQLQKSVFAKVKKELFIKLVELSKEYKELDFSTPDEYSEFINNLMKYIEQYY